MEFPLPPLGPQDTRSLRGLPQPAWPLMQQRSRNDHHNRAGPSYRKLFISTTLDHFDGMSLTRPLARSAITRNPTLSPGSARARLRGSLHASLRRHHDRVESQEGDVRRFTRSLTLVVAPRSLAGSKLPCGQLRRSGTQRTVRLLLVATLRSYGRVLATNAARPSCPPSSRSII